MSKSFIEFMPFQARVAAGGILAGLAVVSAFHGFKAGVACDSWEARLQSPGTTAREAADCARFFDPKGAKAYVELLEKHESEFAPKTSRVVDLYIAENAIAMAEGEGELDEGRELATLITDPEIAKITAENIGTTPKQFHWEDVSGTWAYLYTQAQDLENELKDDTYKQ